LESESLAVRTAVDCETVAVLVEPEVAGVAVVAVAAETARHAAVLVGGLLPE
jgi:hypothetical protein